MYCHISALTAQPGSKSVVIQPSGFSRFDIIIISIFMPSINRMTSWRPMRRVNWSPCSDISQSAYLCWSRAVRMRTALLCKLESCCGRCRHGRSIGVIRRRIHYCWITVEYFMLDRVESDCSLDKFVGYPCEILSLPVKIPYFDDL